MTHPHDHEDEVLGYCDACMDRVPVPSHDFEHCPDCGGKLHHDPFEASGALRAKLARSFGGHHANDISILLDTFGYTEVVV